MYDTASYTIATNVLYSNLKRNLKNRSDSLKLNLPILASLAKPCIVYGLIYVEHGCLCKLDLKEHADILRRECIKDIQGRWGKDTYGDLESLWNKDGLREEAYNTILTRYINSFLDLYPILFKTREEMTGVGVTLVTTVMAESIPLLHDEFSDL